MDKTSTTPGDDPSDDSTAGATPAEDPTKTGTDNQPAENGDDLDPSKSDDTTAADDDKSEEGEDPDKSGDDDKSGEDDAPASFDEDLDEWIDKRGLKKPETEEERQSYQDLRNEQRDFTRERQAKKDANDLSKGIKDNKPDTEDEDDEDADPLEQRVKKNESALEEERTTRQQSEFYSENKVTTEEHKAILDIFKEKTSRPTTKEGKLEAFNYWSKPDALPDLLDLARAKLAKVDNTAVADKAAREERERIARESKSNSPRQNATSNNPSDDSPEGERTKGLLERYSSPK